MGFNLDNYEDVNARVKRFQDAYPMGRIVTEIVELDITKQYAVVRAEVYRDDLAVLPAGVDYAIEWSTKSHVSKTWWLENASTSAIGRALSLVLPTENKATRSDMEKVQKPKPETEVDYWSNAPKEDGFTTAAAESERIIDGGGSEESPQCRHGHMILKEGEKNGKEYRGYTCPEKDRNAQCDAAWMVRSATTGEWRFK